MDSIDVLPDKEIEGTSLISGMFLQRQVTTFLGACHYVHRLPYGYNSNSDDITILFKENMGTCTTKHAVISTLADELSLPVTKTIGIYAMTEAIVTGTHDILAKYKLPYVPMVHCFLEYQGFRIDLTEGNINGKNQSIENFLYTEQVKSNLTKKEEYLLYRKVLKEIILFKDEMLKIDLTTILHARSKGIELLMANVKRFRHRT